MTDCANISMDSLSVLGTVVLALTAIIALHRESKANRMALGVDALLKLQEQFDGTRMIEARKKAATALRDRAASNDPDDVLDFFESIALLTRKRVLDEEFVWHTFYHWLHGYCWAARDYIIQKQQERYEVWRDLCWLHPRLVLLENKRQGRRKSDPDPLTEQELEQFFRDEVGVIGAKS